jgi:acetyl-CoA synthetase
VAAFVILRGSAGDRDGIAGLLRQHVAGEIGLLARPRHVVVVPELPKTRSRKIMRRLLRDVAEGRHAGDETTLADGAVIGRIAALAKAHVVTGTATG